MAKKKYDFSWIDKYRFPSQRSVDEGFETRQAMELAELPNNHQWANQREIQQQAMAQKMNEIGTKAVADEKATEVYNRQFTKEQAIEPTQNPVTSTGFNTYDPGYEAFKQRFPSSVSDNEWLDRLAQTLYYATKPTRDRLENTATGQGVTRFGQTAGDIATAGASAIGREEKASTGNKVADTAIDVAGLLGGFLARPGGVPSQSQAGSLMGSKFQQMATKATPSASAQTIARGAGEGIPFAVADQFANRPERTAGERAADFALDVGLGAGAELGLKYAGEGIEQLIQQLSKERPLSPEVQQMIREQLTNRPAQVAEAKPIQETIDFNVLKPNEGLSGKYRIANQVQNNEDTAARQLELLFDRAKQMDLPPGREYETLQGLWASMATPNSGSLDELIENAGRYYDNPTTQKTNHTVDDMLQVGKRNMDETKQAQAYGVYKPFKVGNLEPRQITKETDPYPTFNKDASKIGDVEFSLPKEPTKKVEAAPPVNKVIQELPKVDPKPAPQPIEEVVQTFKKADPVAKEPNERGFINTLKNSEKSSEPFLQRLKSMYTPITNEETVSRANQRISESIDNASSFVTSADRATPEVVATGHRLIDEFQKKGQFDRAVDIAEKIAELGTKAGQAVQAFSIYNRLTPEGILVHAKRIATKTNEKLPAGQKQVELNGEMAAQLTDLASTVQQMTGTQKSVNDLMSILDKAKKGHKLTDEETKTVQEFVKDAYKFVKNVEPMQRKPKKTAKPTADRTRDKLVTILDAQEKAARDRIRARRDRISSTPFDIYTDYSIIGASKLAKGVIKFSDWAEDMVRDIGEEIRPMLAEIYDRAVEIFDSEKISTQALSEAEKITNRVIKTHNLQGDDADVLFGLARKVSALSGDAKITASQDLQKVLMELERPSIGQRLSTTQTIGQLLNPKTLVRNALGNELFYRVERLNKLIATPIDWTWSKVTGSERSVTFVTNKQGEYWKNWMIGFRAGLKGVNPEGLATQYDLHSNAFNGKWNPMTYLERTLGATLKSFDYAGYKRAVNHTLGEMATLDAINKGLKGDAKKKHIEEYIRNSSDNLLSIADQYGRYVTFQDNNMISVGLLKLKRGLNLGQDFGFGDLILKYPKTPGALIMRALEFSPAGLLRSIYVLSNPFFNREPNKREAMLSLSRAITGTTGFTILGYYLADKGIITGAADKDKDIRELERMTGEGQYRVNWDALKRWVQSGFNDKEATLREGDTFISYDWAQPVAIGVSMGANMNRNIEEKASTRETAANLAGTFYDSIEGGLNTMVEQSVLQGVQRAFETYPGQSVGDKIVDIAGDLPASFAPTLGNQINQFNDNTYRSTYNPDKLQEFVNRVKKKVPGAAQTLPQEFDTLGRPKEVFQDGSNSFFNVFLNPSFTSKYNLTPEAKLVVDVIKETGDKTVAPRKPQKSVTVDGENVKLTPDQYAMLQKIVGEETAKGLSRINPELSDKRKIERILEVLNKAGEKGRKVIKKDIRERGQ